MFLRIFFFLDLVFFFSSVCIFFSLRICVCLSVYLCFYTLSLLLPPCPSLFFPSHSFYSSSLAIPPSLPPIFKRGHQKRSLSHRPTNLISTLGKTMDIIIPDKLSNFLGYIKVIKDSKQDFRNTNLLDFFSDI